MLPGIPAPLFTAVTEKLLQASSLSEPAMGQIVSGGYRAWRSQAIMAEMGVEKITRGLARGVRSFRGESERSNESPVMAIRWRAPKASIF